jgi:hypothetical protein
MMYRATYIPDFYRALHAFVHAEFRARRAGGVLQRWRHCAALPLLRRRVERLATVAPPQPAIRTIPVLTPQAAAIPSEQPR